LRTYAIEGGQGYEKGTFSIVFVGAAGR
jgi:hypothetical protein